MQRTGKIFQQEANGNEIEKYAKRSRDSIMRSAALAVDILDRNFDDRSAIPRCQRRDEPMKLPVKRHLPQNFPAVGFERRSEVVNIDSTQLRHQPVGAAGWNTAQPEIVDAILAPAANNVVSLGDFF